MRKSYDSIAFIYDSLARIVYGKTLVKAQQYLLTSVPANARLLIIGGGTGWIIDELVKLHPSGLHITYVDSSARMIALARERNAGGNTVEFITAPIQEITIAQGYDVILTPFLLDNFTDEMLARIFPVLHQLLNPGGVWLYCDFKNTAVPWQRIMLKIMYLFFRVTCGIPASKLPEAEAVFEKNNYTVLKKQEFLSGFIIAIVYKRQPVA